MPGLGIETASFTPSNPTAVSGSPAKAPGCPSDGEPRYVPFASAVLLAAEVPDGSSSRTYAAGVSAATTDG